ncbi:MAG TPA: hypothetical protein DEQ43_04370 [Nocardioides bacterium]|uniref:hypothetical protein n=1 Tax=uncultured Nocardioides sp. TaxID=198441 RepID=UPI000EC383A4|nr:hypothetical protein [uncultured Nocardioides sp.]HCB03477.1 hypothetical protein [Nocardioides sp.]
MSESTLDTDLVVAGRFRGPARSGNGGYTAGALAALAPGEWPAVTVRLSAPPPIDVAMTVVRHDERVVASYDGAEVARAIRADHELTPVEPLDAASARAAEAGYPGLASHPFPTCFSCGTGRDPGDGLRIFPGPVGDDRVAATWTPDPSVAGDWHEYTDATREVGHAVTWAALDCAGGWAADVGVRHMVLGTMTARLDSLPVVGAEHVVVGAWRGESGRKRISATSLYGADGRLVGTAEQVWIAVDPADFN